METILNHFRSMVKNEASLERSIFRVLKKVKRQTIFLNNLANSIERLIKKKNSKIVEERLGIYDKILHKLMLNLRKLFVYEIKSIENNALPISEMMVSFGYKGPKLIEKLPTQNHKKLREDIEELEEEFKNFEEDIKELIPNIHKLFRRLIRERIDFAQITIFGEKGLARRLKRGARELKTDVKRKISLEKHLEKSIEEIDDYMKKPIEEINQFLLYVVGDFREIAVFCNDRMDIAENIVKEGAQLYQKQINQLMKFDKQLEILKETDPKLVKNLQAELAKEKNYDLKKMDSVFTGFRLKESKIGKKMVAAVTAIGILLGVGALNPALGDSQKQAVEQLNNGKKVEEAQQKAVIQHKKRSVRIFVKYCDFWNKEFDKNYSYYDHLNYALKDLRFPFEKVDEFYLDEFSTYYVRIDGLINIWDFDFEKDFKDKKSYNQKLTNSVNKFLYFMDTTAPEPEKLIESLNTKQIYFEDESEIVLIYPSEPLFPKHHICIILLKKLLKKYKSKNFKLTFVEISKNGEDNNFLRWIRKFQSDYPSKINIKILLERDIPKLEDYFIQLVNRPYPDGELLYRGKESLKKKNFKNVLFYFKKIKYDINKRTAILLLEEKGYYVDKNFNFITLEQYKENIRIENERQSKKNKQEKLISQGENKEVLKKKSKNSDKNSFTDYELLNKGINLLNHAINNAKNQTDYDVGINESLKLFKLINNTNFRNQALEILNMKRIKVDKNFNRIK